MSFRYLFAHWSNTVTKTGVACPDLDAFVEINNHVPVNGTTLNRPTILTTDYGMVINYGVDSAFVQFLYGRMGAVAIRGYANWSTPKWESWKMIATTELPQEFALPLASGVVNNYKSTYHKNQFGEVAVIAALHHATALPAVVATLPAGYRPAIDLAFPAVIKNSSGNVACIVRVGANGQISIK